MPFKQHHCHWKNTFSFWCHHCKSQLGKTSKPGKSTSVGSLDVSMMLWKYSMIFGVSSSAVTKYCFWWIIIPIHHWLWKITEKTTGVKAVPNHPFHICTHYILALPPLFQHSSNVMCLYLQGILNWIVLELWFEDNSEVYLAGIWEIRGRSTH